MGFCHGVLIKYKTYNATGGIGTWQDYLTVPNILKLYNPHIIGYSTGDTTTVDKGSAFNVGEAGALSHQMPYQARVLVERLKKDRRVDFQRDWKVNRGSAES